MARSLHHGGLGDSAACVRDAVANMCDALYILHEAVQRLPEQWSQIDNHLEIACQTEEVWKNIEERLDKVMEERWRCLENRLDAIVEQKVQTLLTQRINMTRSEVMSMKMGPETGGIHFKEKKELSSAVSSSQIDETTGAVRKDKTDARLSALEASVGKALQHMFPRVEALLARFEEQESEYSQFSHPAPACSTPSLPSSSIHSSPTSQTHTYSEQVSVVPEPFNPPLAIRELDSAESLILAAKYGKINKVGDFLNQGTDVNVQDNFGNTALYWAAFRGHYEILYLLIQRGANVNSSNHLGWTPLHAAARWGHAPCISLLLDAGANIESKTINWMTPLHVAANSGREKSVEALLVEGAQMNAKDNKGRTPLDLANSIAVHRLLCS